MLDAQIRQRGCSSGLRCRLVRQAREQAAGPVKPQGHRGAAERYFFRRRIAAEQVQERQIGRHRIDGKPRFLKSCMPLNELPRSPMSASFRTTSPP